jgi:hypothetical protein
MLETLLDRVTGGRETRQGSKSLSHARVAQTSELGGSGRESLPALETAGSRQMTKSWRDISWRRTAFAAAVALAIIVAAIFAAVTVRFGYQALTGPLPEADARNAMWAFAGGVVAAGVTLTGLLFTRAQSARSERRLALETTVNCLKLVMADDGKQYAPRGVVAGAIATLVHLNHPVIAMRTLAACWNDDAVDVPSATWLISEIFETRDDQAQLEAAAMLDAHARELCGATPGSFSWPSAIEYRWLASTTPLPARLRVLRAILTIIVSKPRSWWREGGREGWGAALLHDVMSTDTDPSFREHAAKLVDALLADS